MSEQDFSILLASLKSLGLIVDSATSTADGSSATDQEDQILFGALNLPLGVHQLTITNDGNVDGTSAVFDIDSLIWESELGDGSSTLTIDDTDLSHFSYLPGPSWWSYESQALGAFNKTVSSSSSSVAQAHLGFRGEAVTLYGPVGPNRGNYTCAVDGAAPPNAFCYHHCAISAPSLVLF